MPSTMTRDELVTAVAAKTGLPQAQVHAVVYASIDAIQQALVEQRKVEFRNFGCFKPVVRKARKGRNPRDVSKVYDIAARRVVKFKVGIGLDAALNPDLAQAGNEQ